MKESGGVCECLEADYERLCVHNSFDASDAISDEVSQLLSCFCLQHYDEVVATENAVDFLDAFDLADFFFDGFHEVQFFA